MAGRCRSEGERVSEPKHIRDPHRIPEGGEVHKVEIPYWKRAHQDWRFWVGFVLMIAAITIYVASENLMLLPR